MAPAGRIESVALGRTVRVGVELEHPPRCVDRALDHAVLLEFGRLAQVDQDGSLGTFPGNLVWGESSSTPPSMRRSASVGTMELGSQGIGRDRPARSCAIAGADVAASMPVWR